MNQTTKNCLNFFKVVIVLMPVILLVWLIAKDVAMDGELVFNYDFTEDSPVITNLFPADRLSSRYYNSDKTQTWQTIKNEPVYFEVRLPQQFERAQVQITYQAENLSLVRLGLNEVGGSEWSYNLKPLYNKFLNELDWPMLTSNQGTVWQKNKDFLSWNQFMDQADQLNNLATYYFDFNNQKAENVRLNDQDLSAEIDYIVAGYKLPVKKGDWLVSEVDFDLSRAQTVNRKLRFILSLPEIETRESSYRISHISVKLIRPPLTYGELWQKFINYFKHKFL